VNQQIKIMTRKGMPFTACILILLCLACGRSGIDRGLQAIDEQRIREHTAFLSSDTLQGRAPGSEGSLLARRYIAEEMEKAGLLPGMGGAGYEQSFDMVRIDMDPSVGFSIGAGNQRIDPVYMEEFLVFPGLHNDIINVEDAELVFVGYGIQAAEYGWDDFKDADLKGKILLIMNNDPDTGDPDFFGGRARLYYGRWDYKYDVAASMGAAGGVIIHTHESAGYPWTVVQNSWSGPQFELPSEGGSSLQYKGWVTENLAYRITSLAGADLDELRRMAEQSDFRPVSLGITLDCSFGASYRPVHASNVIGLLPGSDQELKGQAVVITAHYDHLGIGRPVAGDSIYNGALDNASGVASVLELARAFGQMKRKPGRSLVFIATDGEESGLLGSQYYAGHPTFSPADMAASVNIDAINIWGRTEDVVIIGYGKSDLDDVVGEFAQMQGRKTVPDLTPEQGSFYRSDQFNLAKIGVPSIYLDTGQDFVGRTQGWGREVQVAWNSEKYHQPGDEYDASWDLSGHMQDMELLFRVIHHIADARGMPAWLPGDEFEKIRLKSQG
jgi:hypothetical protein